MQMSADTDAVDVKAYGWSGSKPVTVHLPSTAERCSTSALAARTAG